MSLDLQHDRLLTRFEVEQHFAIPKRYLELAGLRGEGPRMVRIGRLVRYRPADVRAWIEAQATEGK
ncbi:AlpA family transcriptional regulator [Sulfitobacter sp. D35]|uniref:helix-turn-helix transcriptional regulator n=1 Tax=Sulfitobacter sp. D35 TaxID=3083252 RepID=UPI00296E68A1|nr:AlpA family transcriptional regulator [Sulfitobacter sp. D35]MDW4500576.1 AlpA family transcriptional regulator [Sulfitobacter sp. D35]